MAKAAERQQLVQVSGISGNFATKGGGDITADTNKVYNGGSPKPDTIAGVATIANVTTSRGYDPKIDGPILKLLRQQVGKTRRTVKVTDLDEDYVAIGNTRTYAQALLVGLTEPTGDASSGNAQTYQLEWAVSSVA